MERLHFSCEDGVELLGSAVSTSAAFISKVVNKRINKCIDSLQRLLMLNDPQLCLMLLRFCEGMPKLTFCWRTIPAKFLIEVSAQFHNEIFENYFSW